MGPCPPSGTHHYEFRLYALSDELDLPETTNGESLAAAMKGKIVAESLLVGTYTRS